MSSRLPFVLFALPVAACASTHAPGDASAERGLAPLRESLGLLAPVGHIERDARGAWFVHDGVGAKIAVVDDAARKAAHCVKVAAQLSPSWVLFEGKPGAALEFDSGQAVAYWFDADRKCAMAASVQAAPSLPDGESIGTASKSWKAAGAAGGEDTGEDAGEGEGEGEDVGDGTQPIDLPGYPGARMRLAESSVSIESASGDLIWSGDGGVVSGNGVDCGGEASASLGRSKLADGSVLLHFNSESTGRYSWNEEDPQCDGADLRSASEHTDVWVRFAAGGGAPVVVQRSSESKGTEEQGTTDLMAMIDVPGGTLVLETHEEQYGYESRMGGSDQSWSWSYKRGDADAIVLASYPPQ